MAGSPLKRMRKAGVTDPVTGEIFYTRSGVLSLD